MKKDLAKLSLIIIGSVIFAQSYGIAVIPGLTPKADKDFLGLALGGSLVWIGWGL